MYLLTRTYVVEEVVADDSPLEQTNMCEQISERIEDILFTCKKCGANMSGEEVAEVYRRNKRGEKTLPLCKTCLSEQ